MGANYTKGLTEKLNDKLSAADKILERAMKEERELTSDEMQEIAEIRDDVRRIKETLAAKGFFDGEKGAEMDDRACGDKKREEQQEAEQRAADDRAAFENYLRETAAGLETRANLDMGSNGAVIPKTIAREIIKRVYDICPILERSQKFNTKGTLAVPVYDETTGAITVGYQDEFDEITANVGKFTSVELTGYLAGALSLISRSLINNTEIDIVAFVVDMMSYKIARFIEGELINGTLNKIAGLSGMTNTMTAASQTAITADEVIQLKDRVKDVFQANSCWIMSPETRTALRLLKDDVGRYLLQDDINAPFGSTLLGKPIYVSDNMPAIAAGAKAIVYGDLSGLATKFNEELNIQILREKYATMHAIGVVGWLEFDAKVIDNQKITALVMASA